MHLLLKLLDPVLLESPFERLLGAGGFLVVEEGQQLHDCVFMLALACGAIYNPQKRFLIPDKRFTRRFGSMPYNNSSINSAIKCYVRRLIFNEEILDLLPDVLLDNLVNSLIVVHVPVPVDGVVPVNISSKMARLLSDS